MKSISNHWLLDTIAEKRAHALREAEDAFRLLRVLPIPDASSDAADFSENHLTSENISF